ncbi:MAG: SIS domain-containing protein [Candidatus Lokiarchaeota archaeon]|nr:SIS domain-containing protein [Candidatus Lokiarchaeota archaeon]
MMYYSKVPVRIEELDQSFEIFNNTWMYLLDQVKLNLDYVFENQNSQLSSYLEFMTINWFEKQSSGNKIAFAATGRSLFMGAKILAHRLAQMGYNVDYPHSEKEISGPPFSKINKDDCLIAISTSGTTASVVQKVEFCREVNCDIIINTSNPKSKITQGVSKLILDVPEKHELDFLTDKYKGKFFAPLGTASEITHFIFAETISRGIYEVKNDSKTIDSAINIMKETYNKMIENARGHITKCIQSSEEDLKNFLTNLILKYFSQHTVHLLGRGKIYDVQIAPFEMRLRQMPHGYVTSIIGYSPKNRPVRPGQIALLSTGSGALSMTAKRVKDFGALLIGITSQKQSEFFDELDIKILLPGRITKKPYDWEKRQYEGGHAEFAPDGSQYEFNGSLLLESIFAGLCNYIGITESDLKFGHANL